MANIHIPDELVPHVAQALRERVVALEEATPHLERAINRAKDDPTPPPKHLVKHKDTITGLRGLATAILLLGRK